ncbi:hypothetical protein AVW15_17520 [Chelatococcus daeguensis]|nr:hypothetical protein AVW15_17520 [Chelatococcus daeguensis]
MAVEHKIDLIEILTLHSQGFDFEHNCAHFYSIVGAFEIVQNQVRMKVAGTMRLTTVESFKDYVGIEPMSADLEAELERAGLEFEGFDHDRVVKLQLVDVEGCRTVERALLTPRPSTLDVSFSVEFPSSFIDGDYRKEGAVRRADIQLVTTF